MLAASSAVASAGRRHWISGGSSRPTVQLRRWRGADVEQIYTAKAPMTFEVNAVFPHGPAPE